MAIQCVELGVHNAWDHFPRLVIMLRCIGIVRLSPISSKLGLSMLATSQTVHHGLSYGSTHSNRFGVVIYHERSVFVVRVGNIVSCCWQHSLFLQEPTWCGRACHELNIRICFGCNVFRFSSFTSRLGVHILCVEEVSRFSTWPMNFGLTRTKVDLLKTFAFLMTRFAISMHGYCAYRCCATIDRVLWEHILLLSIYLHSPLIFLNISSIILPCSLAMAQTLMGSSLMGMGTSMCERLISWHCYMPVNLT